MHATEPAKAIDGNANAFEVRQFNSPVVANHHVFNVAAPVNECADLSANLVREFRELACKLRRQNLVWIDPPGIKLFYTAKLIGLEAGGISYNVLDDSSPPSARVLNARCNGQANFV
jgi:hypothetical protein